jgi:hypothetical protein
MTKNIKKNDRSKKLKPDMPQITQWMTAIATVLRALEEHSTAEAMTYDQLARVINMTPNGWEWPLLSAPDRNFVLRYLVPSKAL